MKELIGKTFRRNKYGISTWEDTVEEVVVTWEHKFNTEENNVTPSYMMPKIRIRGKQTEQIQWYYLDEVVFDYR